MENRLLHIIYGGQVHNCTPALIPFRNPVWFINIAKIQFRKCLFLVELILACLFILTLH